VQNGNLLHDAVDCHFLYAAVDEFSQLADAGLQKVLFLASLSQDEQLISDVLHELLKMGY